MFNPSVFDLSNEYLNGLAALPDGRPAWSVARANGIAQKTFRRRLDRGWTPERAAMEPPREAKPSEADPWEAEAVSNGLSVRCYRSRIRAGWPSHIAAMRAHH